MKKYHYYYKNFRIEKDTAEKLAKAKKRIEQADQREITWNEFFNLIIKIIL